MLGHGGWNLININLKLEPKKKGYEGIYKMKSKMNGTNKFMFFAAFGAASCHISACATLEPTNACNPDDLRKLSSCAARLIVRPKTKADIRTSDQPNRIRAIGLDLYHGRSDGKDLSGKSITYSDTLTQGKSCRQKDISTHYVTSFANLEDYVSAKREVRPIYVRHLTSASIKRDKNIHCEGVFNYYQKSTRANPPPFTVTYNEELCWDKRRK